jgi:NAD(P)-dependent dehydrogenase (short-subunit alcohol dehydrogenase family)
MPNLSIEANMQGKTCLVTGSTHGIGREVARSLAKLGAQVVLHGRNKATAIETLQAIQAESGNSSVSCLLADFSDLQQVRRMAADFAVGHPRLDVLVNNAGAFFLTRHATPNGVELTLQVNHLAPFLLTNLLLKEIRASEHPRIVNVSSGSHWSGQLDLDDLSFQRGYNPIQAYARSKLANILFTYELARRLDGSHVTANAVHPGLVATNIWHIGLPGVDGLLAWWMNRRALSVEEGADTLLYLACSPEVEGIHGKYFIHREAVPSSPESYDVDNSGRLWELSEKLSGLKKHEGHIIDHGSSNIR